MNSNRPAPVSRRTLLGALASAAAATGALAAPARAKAATRLPRLTGPLAHGGYREWSAQVGSEFHVRAEDGTKVLKLVAVKPIGEPSPRVGRGRRTRAFAAVFEPLGGTLPRGDRTYPLSHPHHGRLDLFFGPSGKQITAIFG